MNYNVWTAICVVIVLIIASLIWNRFFEAYLKKTKINKSKYRNMEKETILNLIKPTASLKKSFIMYSSSLNDSDDDISDVLNYVRPSKYLNNSK